MKDTTLAAKVIVEKSKELLEKKLEYAALKGTEKAAQLLGSLAIALVVSMIGIVIVFLLSLVAGLKLAQVTQSKAEGFAIIGSAYGVLFVFAYIFSWKLISKPILNALLKKMVK